MASTSSWSTLLSIDTYSVPIWLFLYPRIYLINKMHQLPDPVLFVTVDRSKWPYMKYRFKIYRSPCQTLNDYRKMHQQTHLLSIEMTAGKFKACK